MNKKIAIIASLTGMALFGIAFIVEQNPISNVVLHAVECNHEGNHYARIEPTDSASGNKEFWICCKCHQVFLNKPSSGTFVDQSVVPFSGGLEKEHLAYLSPLKGGEQGDYYIVDPFDED